MSLDALKAALLRDGRLVLRLRVIPKSQRTEWAAPMLDGTLKLRLHAVPEKGRANDELVRFLAAEFGLPRAHVKLLAGASSQNKQVALTR